MASNINSYFLFVVLFCRENENQEDREEIKIEIPYLWETFAPQVPCLVLYIKPLVVIFAPAKVQPAGVVKSRRNLVETRKNICCKVRNASFHHKLGRSQPYEPMLPINRHPTPKVTAFTVFPCVCSDLLNQSGRMNSSRLALLACVCVFANNLAFDCTLTCGEKWYANRADYSLSFFLRAVFSLSL